MKYTPTDFQQKMINEISDNFRKGKKVLGQLPTRGGKSIIMCHFVELGYKHNRPVLIIAHNSILINQICEDLLESWIPHGVIKSGHYESKDIIQVASVQTLHNRMNQYDPGYFKLVIWDEVHHIKAKTFLEVQQYFSNTAWLGLTATPIRPSSGEGFDDIFDIMVKGPSKRTLIKKHFLVETKVASPMPDMLKGLVSRGDDYTKGSAEKALKETFIHGEYVDQYFQYGTKPDGSTMKGLVFCPTVDFCNEVAANFISTGVSAVVISSKDNKYNREEKLKKYYDGTYKLLISVNLFLEGFTIKECEIIICLRPTKVITVWHQMCGRGSMYCKGKDYLILVDSCNNMYTLGHPDQDYEWTLKGEDKKQVKAKLEELQQKVVRCDGCKWSYDIVEVKKAGITFDPNSEYFTEHPEEREKWANKPDAIFCPYCGAPRETKGRVLKQIEGKLELISLEDYEKYQAEQKWKAEEEYLELQRQEQDRILKKKEIKNAKSLKDLQEIQKKRGYKPGWAEHKWHSRSYAMSKFTATKF